MRGSSGARLLAAGAVWEACGCKVVTGHYYLRTRFTLDITLSIGRHSVPAPDGSSMLLNQLPWITSLANTGSTLDNDGSIPMDEFVEDLHKLNSSHASALRLTANNLILMGKRIVDLKVLANNLRCSKCNEYLYLDKVLKDKYTGLDSTLIICCDKCKRINEVRTNKEHECQAQQRIYSDINSAAVFGAVHSGMGCTGLNKLLAVMNIPTISNDLYKRYEREVGPAIEKAAKESCRRAAEEERRLVIQNVKRLCEELPPEIVDDIYPNLQIFESSTINNNLNCELDAALLDIINIIISYDMGWTKRGNGRSYDSLNGYEIIIGFLRGKILDYATRNRKCALCDRGHDKADHNCRKNYHGSAKAMEADAGAQLINHSQVLKDVGLKFELLLATRIVAQ
ncbi:uncharacterized protein [Temnothorax longispinosus]|uniref:uncharacterized protein n=1 Tax=Temnothorax longispinosus TaxID=300112 RepID=UPI003A9A3928